MKVSTLMNQLEDFGVDRQVVVEIPDPLTYAINRYEVKAARIEGDTLVVVELGEAVAEASS